MTEISFPRQYARTRRFSLGVPRAFVISPDGERILFLRSKSGSDPVSCLYELDVTTAMERLVVDPEALLASGAERLAPEEKARRERARESSSGIVRFHADSTARRAVFDLSGRVFLVDIASAAVAELAVTTPAVDPRLSPSGEEVAYVSAGALRVIGATGSRDRAVAGPDTARDGASSSDQVTYGLAEFVAAEEMDRLDGYWWSPDSRQLLVARVDTSQVSRRYIADPADPNSAPVELAYPAAGGANAEVTLQIVNIERADGRIEVAWDRRAFEYLTAVCWTKNGLLVAVQSRDQGRIRLVSVDPSTGACSIVREDQDPLWVDVVAGVPAQLSDGTIVWTADLDGAKRLLVGDVAVTPPSLQVRHVLGVDGDTVLFAASIEPTEVGVWSWSRLSGPRRLGADDGQSVTTGWCGGGTTVLAQARLDNAGIAVDVYRDGQRVARIGSLAETPVIAPRPLLRWLGQRPIRTAVLFPEGHEPGSKRLPVLLDPYGGPHAQMVMAASRNFLVSQWFANQGYCVVVADGRGTPGRGPDWDRAVFGKIASIVLEDQVSALHSAAETFEDLDLSRVAIRGWSFGGYLAALAVLRRPEVFHAAVAGAPVTEWRLYDTHYTERYLGDPRVSASVYDENSLIGSAAGLRRPLLLIHGLADDNVTAANTLQLSSALLAAGRPHCVLPLSGVTHMTPQEVVAENLLLLQVDFLRSALSRSASTSP